MAGNHNASPFSVDDPEIAEVLDMRTSSISPAHEAIGSDYDQAMALRMELGEASLIRFVQCRPPRSRSLSACF